MTYALAGEGTGTRGPAALRSSLNSAQYAVSSASQPLRDSHLNTEQNVNGAGEPAVAAPAATAAEARHAAICSCGTTAGSKNAVSTGCSSQPICQNVMHCKQRWIAW